MVPTSATNSITLDTSTTESNGKYCRKGLILEFREVLVHDLSEVSFTIVSFLSVTINIAVCPTSVGTPCHGTYCPYSYYTGSTCIDGYCRCDNVVRDYCSCLGESLLTAPFLHLNVCSSNF